MADLKLVPVNRPLRLVPVDGDSRQSVSPNWVGRSLESPVESIQGGQEYLGLVRKNESGRRGLFEEFTDPEAREVPWFGSFSEIPNLVGITKTAKKLHEDEYVTDEELIRLNTYLEFQRRKSLASPAAKVLDVVQNSLSFGAEIASSFVLSGLFAAEPVSTAIGGAVAGRTAAAKTASKAARKATQKFVNRALGKTAAKLVGQGSAAAVKSHAMTKAIGKAVDVSVRKATKKMVGAKAASYLGKIIGVGANLESKALIAQALNPQRTIRTVAERRLVDAISQGDESVAASIAKGIADMNIEYASEFSGEYLGAMAKRLLPKKLIKALGQQEIIRILSLRTGSTNQSAILGTLRTMGVDGMVEEMLEERAGGFMRGLFGINSDAGLKEAIKEAIPTGEQFMTEAVAFSVLPMMASGISRITGGVTAGEYAENLDALKSLEKVSPDISAKTEEELRNEARVLHAKLVEENTPWYIDTKFEFLKKVFGEERRGTVQSMLNRKGVVSLRKVHDAALEANPDNPDAGIDAITEFLAMAQNVQSTGIMTQKDADLFNAGVKSGDIFKKTRGRAARFFASREALDNAEYEKLVKQTGISTVTDIDEIDTQRIGQLSADQFSTSWEKLSSDAKQELSRRWHSKDAAYLKERYEYFQSVFSSPQMDVAMFETVPFVVTGTAKQFSGHGYEIDNLTDTFKEGEDGKIYAMDLSAVSSIDGTEIDVSTHAPAWAVTEDVIESKLKQVDPGLNLFGEANSWMDEIHREIQGKGDKASVSEKRVSAMLSSKIGRFEFLVKTYYLNRMGYSVDADRAGRSLAKYDVPDDVHQNMLFLVGDDLIQKLSKTDIEGIDRGERHERVREIQTTRPAGGTAEARKLVSEGQSGELVNQLADALGKDMRSTENRNTVQSILDEMDKTGVTFSLSAAFNAENEFEDLKRAVETGNEEDITRASKNYWIKLPKPEDVTPKEPERTKPRTISPAVTPESAETRTPEGGSIRKEFEVEQPTPEFAEPVPEEEGESRPRTFRFDRPGARRILQPRDRARSGQEIPAVASSPGAPFSGADIAVRFDLQEQELLQEEETKKQALDGIFGEETTAADTKQISQDLREEQKVVSKTGLRLPRASWRMENLESGAIAPQIEAVTLVGMHDLARYGKEVIPGLFPNAAVHDRTYIPKGVPMDRLTGWISKQTRQGYNPVVSRLHNEALFDDISDSEGVIAIVDWDLETKLASPVQRAIFGAQTGRVAQGRTYRSWQYAEREPGQYAALEDVDSDEIISQIDVPIGKPIDFVNEERGTPDAFRSAVFPISPDTLDRIRNSTGSDQKNAVDKLAFRLHDWIRRNKIRRLMIVGLGSLERQGDRSWRITDPFKSSGIEFEKGDTIIYPNEQVVPARWLPAFSRTLTKATGSEIGKQRRGPDMPHESEATPTELTQAQIRSFEAELEQRSTFSLADTFKMGMDLIREADKDMDFSTEMDRGAMLMEYLQGNLDLVNDVYQLLPDSAKAEQFKEIAIRAGVSARPRLTPDEILEAEDVSTQDELDSADFLDEPFDFEDQQETASLAVIDNLYQDLDPAFRGGSAGLHQLMLDQNRKLKAIKIEEQAFVDQMNRKLGLSVSDVAETARAVVPGQERVLPENHKPLARNMLASVGARLDGSKRIPVSKGKWIEPGPALAAWDNHIKENNLDMPTSAQVQEQIREKLDSVRDKANEIMQDFTEQEWIDYIEDYITHVYRSRSKQETVNAVRRMKEDARQAKRRRIPSYEKAAQKYNLFPRTMNALDLYQSWNDTVWAAARNKSLVSIASTVRDFDGAPVVIPVKTGEMKPGEDQLIDDLTLAETAKHLAAFLNEPYDASAGPAAEIARLVGSLDVEANDYIRIDSPLTKSVDYFIVRKGTTANIMKTVLNYGRIDNDFMNGIERFNAWSKFMMLSFSAFHPFALLESLTATFGVSFKNPAFHIPSTYKSINELVKDMQENPEKYREWYEAGFTGDVGNPDVQLGIIEQDLQRGIDRLEETGGYVENAKFALKGLQNYKRWLDKWLWHSFLPGIKMHSAEFVLNEWRTDNPNATPEELHEARKKIVEYINPAFGGLEWEQYTWATPRARQMLHALFFAPDWSFSSAQISGLTRIPFLNRIHATKLSPLMRDQMLRKYWPAMTAIVLFGLPNLVQFAIYSASKVVGGGDPDDVPFTFMNEPGRKTHIDFTPVFRNVPFIDQGASGKRRIYMRWGKQAYEVFEGWLGDPAMILRKSSSVVRQAIEQTMGTSVTGWDLPFKDEGWLGILTADGSAWKGRAGFTIQKFLPISLTSLAQGKPTAFIAPTSKGVTEGSVIFSMRKTLEAYIDKNALPKALRPVDLSIIVPELMDAARRNGINPELAFRRAKGTVVSKYYRRFFEALNKGDSEAMEEAARDVVQLGKGLRDFNRSVQGRLEALDREYTPGLKEQVAEAVLRAREAE